MLQIIDKIILWGLGSLLAAQEKDGLLPVLAVLLALIFSASGI